MNIATRALLEVQEMTLLVARAARGLFKRPRYFNEIVTQMDIIGVGSLTIILLTGFFTGGVLTLQTYPTLKYYGAQDQTGRLVAISLVRELGPVLTALMVTGRVQREAGLQRDAVQIAAEGSCVADLHAQRVFQHPSGLRRVNHQHSGEAE